MLEVGLIGGGAAEEERRLGGRFIGNVAGVVVGNFVVVPRDDPWGDGMGALEGGIGFVEGVAGTVVVELEDLGAVVAARWSLAAPS